MDPETVATEFGLDMADIYRTLTYYYENIDSIDVWRDRRERRVRGSLAVSK
jgi:hypothetical protein